MRFEILAVHINCLNIIFNIYDNVHQESENIVVFEILKTYGQNINKI